MMSLDPSTGAPVGSTAAAERSTATRHGLGIRTRGLTLRYGSHEALSGVDLDLTAGRVHGLLGRNGAGKTTLLSVLASLLPRTAGELEIGGGDPFENEALMPQICLIREAGNVVGDERISWNLDFHAMARPSFDHAWATELVRDFGLDPRRKPDKLSRGERSMLGAALGLASRAPLTMFDEVQLGMDAPTREHFSELLIAELAERPRTVVLSSHLISELEPLLETVTILQRGRVVLSAAADDVRARGLTITGPAGAVDALAAGLPVVASRDLGPTRQVTIFAGPGCPADVDDILQRAERDGLSVAAAPLQDLFIRLTEEE